MEQAYFTIDEREVLLQTVRKLLCLLGNTITNGEINKVHSIIKNGVLGGFYNRDKYGINPVVRNLETALLLAEQVAPDKDMAVSIMLYNLCKSGFVSEEAVLRTFGDDVTKLVRGLINVSQLYQKQAAVENDNFHKLLLTFAEDIRVVIIMIVDRLGLMRKINHHPDEKFVHDISFESRYLYAPLAHKLGLYTIKSELEDLSLKYLNRKVYAQIAHKLNETKQKRNEYIENFIVPIRQVLEKSGLKFEVKGRTKSINSIWNKMKKKDIDLNGMYDLFAIRIIIDTPLKDEKKDCWLVYSLVTDIYDANPSRLKDWITIPKSNGYESLHITVKGPEDKWVEVQIRTKRMDAVAERGLAAHWRYKGIQSEGELDVWMNNVREILEAGSKGPMELIRGMNMHLYEKEVFVFTPKGDLFKLPAGSTILDFAFHIHSKIGTTCIGGKVDGKNQKLNYRLKSGDTVEILTASNQTPRVDWLNYAVTSKARNKIKQAINESRVKKAEIAREMVMRRLKNRKLDVDDATLTKFITKSGYKNLTDFYVDINDGKMDVGAVLDQYSDFVAKQNVAAEQTHETAQHFVLQNRQDEDNSDDILVIDQNIKGINYKLSKCCNPILGDKIMGFISSDGAIKVHRVDCGNIIHLREKFPYRIINARWSGKIGKQFAVTLNVIGRDDIGIISSITSVINKSGDTVLRNISIDSNGSSFQGHLVIGVDSIGMLDDLIKKILGIKGVKNVERVFN